jgi:peptide deformylase
MVEVPLFNHYVFVQLAEKDRNLVFAAAGVIRYLFWSIKHTIVKDAEIETIKEWLSTVDAEDISLTAYQIGRSIQLRFGTLFYSKRSGQGSHKDTLCFNPGIFGLYFENQIKKYQL